MPTDRPYLTRQTIDAIHALTPGWRQIVISPPPHCTQLNDKISEGCQSLCDTCPGLRRVGGVKLPKALCHPWQGPDLPHIYRAGKTLNRAFKRLVNCLQLIKHGARQ